MTLRTSIAFDRRVGLRVGRGVDVDEWLPHWWVDVDVVPERTWTVPGQRDVSAAIGRLEVWVAEHARGLVFVRAGVVAVRGRALLLPGRSSAGTSTLTAALLRAGADYGSDEYAVLQPDGRVRAYPRPLALRSESCPLRPESLGARTLDGPVSVSATATVRFRACAPLELTSTTPSTAARQLIDNAVCAHSRPAETLTAVSAAVDGAVTVDGVRGEADEACATLLGLLA